MKKILFLLLVTTASYSQALFDKGIKVTGGITTDNTATKVVVQSANNVLNTILKDNLIDVVIVNTTAELTSGIGNIAKLYATRDNTIIYRYNGTIYVALGGDISAKEDVANKQNSLAVDGTNLKYPTVTAVNSGLALKANNISQLESNATDLTVWNNGKGNIVSNTSFGDQSLRVNTTGLNNTSIGQTSLLFNTTGSNNTSVGTNALGSNNTGGSNVAVGSTSLQNNTTGSSNTVIGSGALQANVTGASNIAIGVNAGSVSGFNNTNNSIFLGVGALPSANNLTNEIVIGNSVVGAGSNTVTLGNASITSTILKGTVSGGSFIKSSAPSTNILLAGGGDIAQSSFIGGSGTTNFLPKFTASGTVGNSMVSDDGTKVSIQGLNKGIGTSPTDFGNLNINTTDSFAINKGGSLSLGGVYNSGGAIASFAKIHGKSETSVTGSFDGKLVFEVSNNTTSPFTKEVASFSSTGVFKVENLSGTGQRIVTANASGQLSATTIPVFADNTAAIAGGLGVGALYRTVVGLLAVVF